MNNFCYLKPCLIRLLRLGYLRYLCAHHSKLVGMAWPCPVLGLSLSWACPELALKLDLSLT